MLLSVRCLYILLFSSVAQFYWETVCSVEFGCLQISTFTFERTRNSFWNKGMCFFCVACKTGVIEWWLVSELGHDRTHMKLCLCCLDTRSSTLICLHSLNIVWSIFSQFYQIDRVWLAYLLPTVKEMKQDLLQLFWYVLGFFKILLFLLLKYLLPEILNGALFAVNIHSKLKNQQFSWMWVDIIIPGELAAF